MKSNQLIAMIFLCALYSAQAQGAQIKGLIEIKMISLTVDGADVISSLLKKTKPTIRILNILIPVDMKSFKIKTNKWSRNMDKNLIKWEKNIKQIKDELVVLEHFQHAKSDRADDCGIKEVSFARNTLFMETKEDLDL